METEMRTWRIWRNHVRVSIHRQPDGAWWLAAGLFRTNGTDDANDLLEWADFNSPDGDTIKRLAAAALDRRAEVWAGHLGGSLPALAAQYEPLPLIEAQP